MPSNDEMRASQKTLLFQLKMVDEKQITLERLMAMTKASMAKEDIAWVEQQFNKPT